MDRKELQDFVEKHAPCKVIARVSNSCERYTDFEGELYYEDDRWFILSDVADGWSPTDTGDYKYGWSLGVNFRCADQVKAIRLAEDEPVTLEQFKNEKIAIHCETEEEADELMRYFVGHRITWHSGYVADSYDGYADCNEWYIVYQVGDTPTGLGHGDEHRILELGCRIIKAKDFLRWNTFSKESDLRSALGNDVYEPVTLEQFKNEDIAIHCETEELAEELLAYLDSKGMQWWTSGKLTECTHWNRYKANTCYSSNVGYDTKNGYKNEGYRIIKAKDFLRWNQFKYVCRYEWNQMVQACNRDILVTRLGVQGLYKNPNNLTHKIMETLREVPQHLKRLLSKKHRVLYKRGWLNSDLSYNSEYHGKLTDILAEEYEDKMVELAEKDIKEFEEEAKK